MKGQPALRSVPGKIRRFFFKLSLYRLSAAWAALNLLAPSASAGDFERDIEVYQPVYVERFGAHVFARMQPVHVNLGDMKGGVLYAYDKIFEGEYSAYVEYYYNKKRIVLQNGMLTRDIDPYVISVFNIRYLGSQCIVLIYHFRPFSRENISYFGDVYCLQNGAPYLVERLSSALDYKKNAAEARKALAPLLK
jgi:hypothetical protein